MGAPALWVEMQLTNFSWLRTGSGLSGGTIYLWAVFFKIDGDTVSLGQNLQLQGKATVVAKPGNQGDLGSNDFGVTGGTIPIPPTIGRYRTVLRAVPVLGNFVSGVIGCVAVVLVQMGTPADAIRRFSGCL